MENNSALMNEVRDVYKLQLGRDKFPKSVIPVVDVNPKHARIINLHRESIRTTTGTGTMYTTSAIEDTYLTGFTLTLQADVTCDNTSGAFFVTIDGASRPTRISKLTTTATSMTLSHTFAYPLKLDRNTTITLGSTFTVGACTMSCMINGFTVSNSNA